MDKPGLAKQVLEVIPSAMAKIRTEWRDQAAGELSVPQLRILNSIFNGRNLIGDIAKHQGVSQPAMSMLVEILIQKKLLKKSKATKDKRQSPLTLTSKGRRIFLKSRKLTTLKLDERIKRLNRKERAQLQKGLTQLQKIFLDSV